MECPKHYSITALTCPMHICKLSEPKLTIINFQPTRCHGNSEYNILSDLIANCDDRSPPEEASFKNILISIRDRPTIVDETVTVKRSRKPGLLGKRTDSVSPSDLIKPRVAYSDKGLSYVPGKAVKVIGDPKVSGPQGTRRRVSDGCVGLRPETATPPFPNLDPKPPDLMQSDADFKTRSCNDIVRLILTKHGIHVISDTEAIV